MRRAGGPLHRGGPQPRSRRCSRCCGRWSTLFASTRTSRTSGSTAPSATTWPSSSSRSGSRLTRPGGPARPGPLPAGRAGHRRSPARGRHAAPLRLRGRRPLHRRPAARPAPRARTSATRGGASARATTRPGEYAAAGRAWPASRSSAATSSRSCRARPSSRPARRRPRELFRRLRERNPSPYGFLINLGEARVPGRRLARDVRARRRRPRRDLPDLGHHRPRPRRHRRRRPDPGPAQLGQGRVRADDVHRRRPQRQVAHLRARAACGSSAGGRSRCTRGSSTPSTTSRGGCARP